MGDILDKLKAASNGNPYSGNGDSNTQETQGSQTSIIGSPNILKHSLDSQPIMTNPSILNENGDGDFLKESNIKLNDSE